MGGLSRPSKMPCFAWGIPAITCITGAKLAKVAGSVCQGCYALKGFYRRQNVQQAYQRRLDRFGDPRWIQAMVKLVYWQAIESGTPHFRWFDSGDIQSVEMLRKIDEVARLTPQISHWLPTREYRMVEGYLADLALPENLVVRLSGHMVDGTPPAFFDLPTSTVHSSPATAHGQVCPARMSVPANCGSCRACWSKERRNIGYERH